MDRSFFHFVTNHASDRQTDGQTDGRTDRRTETSSQYRVCITCSAVKIIRRPNENVIYINYKKSTYCG